MLRVSVLLGFQLTALHLPTNKISYATLICHYMKFSRANLEKSCEFRLQESRWKQQGKGDGIDVNFIWFLKHTNHCWKLEWYGPCLFVGATFECSTTSHPVLFKLLCVKRYHNSQRTFAIIRWFNRKKVSCAWGSLLSPYKRWFSWLVNRKRSGSCQSVAFIFYLILHRPSIL